MAGHFQPACVAAYHFSRASSRSLKTFILSWFSNLVAAQSDRMSALSGRMSKAAFRYSSTHRPVHRCEVAQTIQAFASSFPPPLLSNVKQDGKNKKNILILSLHHRGLWGSIGIVHVLLKYLSITGQDLWIFDCDL